MGSSAWFKIKLGMLTVSGLVGIVWVANLPVPGIRQLVSRHAPVLLIPSYISMDHHYRHAIALVEQADQLVNRAISVEDLDLGSTKVKSAQQHLDALPVAVLGDYPTAYCRWTTCRWRFTHDEFRSARQTIARMEARLFQESNARTQLEQAEQALGEALEAFHNGTDKPKAIADWQSAIDSLKQIPALTLAGRLAQPKIAATERDFLQSAGQNRDRTLTQNLIEGAKPFATKAAQLSKQKPQSAASWREIEQLWQEAINRLNKISAQDASYLAAQQQLVNYKQALINTQIQRRAEETAVQSYENAQRLKQGLIANADPKFVDRPYVKSQLHRIIAELEKVERHTTVYADAQALIKSTQDRLQ